MLVAIDGGGTKTDFVLVDINGMIIKRVLTDGCNLADSGITRMREVLKAGLDVLLSEIKPSDEISAAFAGVSGGTVGDNKRLMNELLHELLLQAKATLSDSDVISALSSGIENEDGCVVIAGTGTSGFIRKKGLITRIGGWGFLFDKGGSGYDFGRDAVYHTLCAYDGRGPDTVLTELLSEALGAPAPLAITNLYKQGKPAIAALAPLVFKAEKLKDDVAIEIIRDNAQEMAKLMNALSAAMRASVCNTILAGSIFKDFDTLKKYLLPLLNAKHVFIFPSLPPVYGSAVEALALSGTAFTKEFKANFAATLTDEKTIKLYGLK